MTIAISFVLLFLSFLTSLSICGDCPVGFDQVASKCITIAQTKSIHPTGKKECQTLGAQLVSIHNSIDNHAILTYTSNLTTPMWIGLNCKVNKKPEACTWDDGSAIDYNNFLPGYPVTNIGSCVYLDPSNQPLKGRWVSASCDIEHFYSICEISSPKICRK